MAVRGLCFQQGQFTIYSIWGKINISILYILFWISFLEMFVLQHFTAIHFLTEVVWHFLLIALFTMQPTSSNTIFPFTYHKPQRDIWNYSLSDSSSPNYLRNSPNICLCYYFFNKWTNHLEKRVINSWEYITKSLKSISDVKSRSKWISTRLFNSNYIRDDVNVRQIGHNFERLQRYAITM